MSKMTGTSWPYYKLPSELRPEALARLPMKFYSSLSAGKEKIPWILVSLEDRILLCRAVPSAAEPIEYVEASSNLWIPIEEENKNESTNDKHEMSFSCTLGRQLLDKPKFAVEVKVELEGDFEAIPNFLSLMRGNLVHKPICEGLCFRIKMPSKPDEFKTFFVRSIQGETAAKQQSSSMKFFLVAPQTAFTLLNIQKTRKGKVISCPIGLEHEFSQVKDLLDERILEGIRSIGQTLPKGVLMSGPPGVGKTFLVRHIADQLGIPVMVVNGPELISPIPGESEQNLIAVFESARQSSTTSSSGCSILFFDEIDAIARKRENDAMENNVAEVRLLTRLLTLLDGFDEKVTGVVDSKNGHVIVFAATNRPNSLDPAMRRPGRFDREILFEAPDASTRSRILRGLFDSSNLTVEEEVDFDEIGRSCIGYVPADLSALVQQISLSNVTQSQNSVTRLMVCEAMKLVGPSLHRQYQIALDSRVTWQDIAGIDEIKNELRRFIEWPLLHADAYKRMGLRPPRGVLLHGPPGCSKTTIAKAIANESNFTFYSLNGASLFSCYLGESEQQIREIFQCARMTAPSVIFFDEIDAIVGKRSSEQSSDAVQERVLSTLLNEMDGIDLACSTSNVLVIGATNRPDLIDEALLRPGRFDRHICIPLPSQTGRQDILRLFLRGKEFEESLDFSELARRTEGFSGADLKGLVQEAGLLAMHDNSFKFCMDHFNKILNSPGRRRVNIKEEKEYR